MTPGQSYKTPGQLIHDLLQERDWTQRVLAIVLGSDESTINKIIAGKRPLDAETALALSELFKVPAERFMELQQSYDLAQARLLERPDPARTNRAHLFGNLPVTEMIKRGWLDADDVRNVPKVESALSKFFNASSLNEIEILPHAAKKTNVASPATPAQLAWLYRVKQIAGEILVSKYSPEAVEDAVVRLSALRGSSEDTGKVPKILQNCGIRFILVESLPGAKIDGVCFWLNDKSPVIALSILHDRIDNFWFVLRHEIEHVLRRDGRAVMMLDVDLQGERAGTGSDLPEEERAANAAAAEFCVNQASLKQFIDRKAPFFADRDIIGFARTLKIHPGLVAGQIGFRTKRYDRFRHHLVKVRSFVAPNAFKDGWGDIFPLGI